MPPDAAAVETILIVDDEEPVRRTFREWLEGAGLGCRILAAADAEAALVQANQHTIDLAILDWNLGAGNDGLQLLEDLYLFNPDVVAIMITGYRPPGHAARRHAHGRPRLPRQEPGPRPGHVPASGPAAAGPHPARQARAAPPPEPGRLPRGGGEGPAAGAGGGRPQRPGAAAGRHPQPVPLPAAHDRRPRRRAAGPRTTMPTGSPPEICRVYDAAGAGPRRGAGAVRPLRGRHRRQHAGALRHEPARPAAPTRAGCELQPFERGRRSLLAAPLALAPGIHVVLELFDKEAAATSTSRTDALLAAAADFGAEMLRQALAERQTHRVLLDAVAAALGASDSVAESLNLRRLPGPEEPPPAAVLDQLREGLEPPRAPPSGRTRRFAWRRRSASWRCGTGTPAVEHCISPGGRASSLARHGHRQWRRRDERRAAARGRPP